MDMTDTRVKFHKPEPRKRTKGRKLRKAAKVVKSIRALCVERDGFCRLVTGLLQGDDIAGVMTYHECGGVSEWAHMHSHRRSKTRGQKPERRHTTRGSLMLCTSAHDAYDAKKLKIRALTRKGADGPLRFSS